MRIQPLLTAVALGLAVFQLPGDDLVARWDFNDATLHPSVGQGQLAALGGVTTSFASGAGSSDPATSPDQACHLAGFPTQGTKPGSAGLEVWVDTFGFADLQLTFDLRPSGAASRHVLVLCSDGGADFVEAGRFVLETSGVFTNGLTVDLRSFAFLNQNPDCRLRIVSDFGASAVYEPVSGNYSSSGTWRLDRISVSGRRESAAATAPQIRSAPTGVVCHGGETVDLAVFATGSAPLEYQWSRNGTNLVGATNAVLRLPEVQLTEAGEYRVEVRNSLGRVVSEPARVVVELPPPVLSFTNRLLATRWPGDLLTNSFLEQVVRPGETWELDFEFSVPGGGNLTFDWAALVSSKPTTSTLETEWTAPEPSAEETGRRLNGHVWFAPSEDDAGRRCAVQLRACNASGTNATTLVVYVPTVAERGVVLTEFYANPTADAAAEAFNPLARTEIPTADLTAHDEFVEWVNVGTTPLDLGGWSVSDAVAVRHIFSQPTELPAATAVVVYGGPAEGFAPSGGFRAVPASRGGLSLNNGGDLICLRNAASNLVHRVSYAANSLAADGSVARSRSNGVWVAHRKEAGFAWSPGSRSDGAAWNSVNPDPEEPRTVGAIAVSLLEEDSGRQLRLRFVADPQATYSLWAATDPAGEFRPELAIAAPGEFRVPLGDETLSATESRRFFRVSSP